MKEKKVFLKTVLSLFIVLCILFIPFPFNLLDSQVLVTDLIFGKLISFFSTNVFGITLTDTRVHSDSVSMYVLVLLLFIFSVLIGILFAGIAFWKKHSKIFFTIVYWAGCYYLLMMLLKY